MQIGANPKRVTVPAPTEIGIKGFPEIPGIPLGPEEMPITPAEMPTVPAEAPEHAPAEAPARKENDQGYSL